jgi:hypothetical protein
MDEFKHSYLQSYIQILRYIQMQEIISFLSGSNRLHKLASYVGKLCPKGSERSSILED